MLFFRFLLWNRCTADNVEYVFKITVFTLVISFVLEFMSSEGESILREMRCDGVLQGSLPISLFIPLETKRYGEGD